MGAQAPTDVTRLAVLASGTGTNLQAIIDACARGELAAEVVVVATNRPGAVAVTRARSAGIPTIEQAVEAGEQRADYDARLADAVASFEPDWVVLAGWMRILTSRFLDRFAARVINLHPALPGQLPGTHAIERAFEEARRGERSATGVMVHLVPDEGVDDGPVLGSVEVPILPDDTLPTLTERVHAAEHRLLIDTLRSTCTPPTERSRR
jgi:phosphoribosylglycinamide formyltransferase-1